MLKNRILIAPLDWGLGHLTRCIPIVNKLLQNPSVELTIGASAKNIEFIENEFPNIKILMLPSYNINYSKDNSQILSLLFNFPKILKAIFNEHFLLKQNISKFDIIISDNRFGLWNKNIYTIFITHQVNIKLPKQISFLEKIVFFINKKIIEKYNELWIPDFEAPNNLSGELSYQPKIKIETRYLGVLSRFKNLDIRPKRNPKHDIILILSGPEPQRSILEKIVLNQLLKSKYTALIVQGKTNENVTNIIDKRIEVISYLNTNQLLEKINDSKYIISRSGYTSIMDLYVLKRTAILIPTPGQTEQEYLADYLKTKKMFYSVEQSKFDLETALQQISLKFIV